MKTVALGLVLYAVLVFDVQIRGRFSRYEDVNRCKKAFGYSEQCFDSINLLAGAAVFY